MSDRGHKHITQRSRRSLRSLRSRTPGVYNLQATRVANHLIHNVSRCQRSLQSQVPELSELGTFQIISNPLLWYFCDALSISIIWGSLPWQPGQRPWGRHRESHISRQAKASNIPRMPPHPTAEERWIGRFLSVSMDVAQECEPKTLLRWIELLDCTRVLYPVHDRVQKYSPHEVPVNQPLHAISMKNSAAKWLRWKATTPALYSNFQALCSAHVGHVTNKEISIHGIESALNHWLEPTPAHTPQNNLNRRALERS